MNALSAIRSRFLRYLAVPLWLGVQRHPWRFACATMGAYGTIWTLVDSSSFFFSEEQVRAVVGFPAMVLVSLGAGLCAIAQWRSIELRGLGAGNTTLCIYFGDLFAARGHKVIPVNEFFDSELGAHVALGSVHGAMIDRYFGGHSNHFDTLVDASLAGSESVTVSRPSGRARRYEIGTVAVVPYRDEKLFVVALAHTDLTTLKAYATTLDLWKALDALWEKVRVEANGQPITLPLVGGGLASVPLPCTALLQCIVASVHAAAVKGRITETINIALHESLFAQIDLEVIRQQWS